MAPFLNTLISRIVFGETRKSRPDIPRPPSIVFSEGDFPGSQQHYEGYSPQPSSLDNGPNTGDILPAASGASLGEGIPAGYLQTGDVQGNLPQQAPFRQGPDEGISEQPLPLPTISQHGPPQSQSPSEAASSMEASQSQQARPPETDSVHQIGSHARGRDTGSVDSTASSAEQQGTTAGSSGGVSAANAVAQDATSSDGSDSVGPTATTKQVGSTAAAGSGGGQALEAAVCSTENGDVQTSSQGTEQHRRASSDAIGPVTATHDFVSLVQGTQDLIGMLGARGVS